MLQGDWGCAPKSAVPLAAVGKAYGFSLLATVTDTVLPMSVGASKARLSPRVSIPAPFDGMGIKRPFRLVPLWTESDRHTTVIFLGSCRSEGALKEIIQRRVVFFSRRNGLLLRIYRLRRESCPNHTEDLLLEGGTRFLLRQLLGIRTHSVENICVPGTGNALQNVPRFPAAFLVQIEPELLESDAHSFTPFFRYRSARYSYPFAVAQMSSRIVTRRRSYLPKLRMRHPPPPTT